MTQRIKQLYKLLFCVLLLLPTHSAFSNAAQPGIWNAGGSGVFSLLYPQDSSSLNKIRMQSEQVYVKLFPGFAVVKGVYHFENKEDSSVQLKIGYPINTIFDSKNEAKWKNDINFDALHGIKATWNNSGLPLFDTTENWYVWDAEFPQNSTSTLSVYFLVSTNNASQSQGYNRDKRNAFIYLIETGSIWKSPIDQGEFYVFIDEEISLESIRANYPSKLQWNQEHRLFKLHLKDYGYSPDENLIFTYHDQIKDFDITQATSNIETYFQSLDELSSKKYNTINFVTFNSKSPFEVEGMGNTFVTLLYYSVFFLPIIGFLIALFIGVKLFKYFKRKRQNNA